MPQAFVLGLDWIGSPLGWAYCEIRAELADGFELGCLTAADVPRSPLVRKAARVVVDAPIGLSAAAGHTAASRPCDYGARRWLGPLFPAIFSPPVQAELAEWRTRRQRAEPQRRGHARGLLPAIDSAKTISEANRRTIESHPELVFAALMGRPFPAHGSKRQLLGLLARASILAEQGIALQPRHLLGFPAVATDNALDAIAMAVVARAWLTHRDGLQVVRRGEGAPEHLRDIDRQEPHMALPGMDLAWPLGPALSGGELVALAAKSCSRWSKA
jgi:hypothetical protein